MINENITTFSKEEVTKLINERYVDDVRVGLRTRNCYKITGDVCETLAQIFICVGSVISFSAGIWNYNYLSYVAGAFGVFSISLHRFGIYAHDESRERTDETNRILVAIGVGKIVDIAPENNKEII
jgi:hypothetical protein